MRITDSFLYDLACKTVDLNIHLDSCNSVMCSGDLEVHIAEEILKTLNICQNDVVIVCLACHKTAGDTCYCLLDRNTGCHQSHGGGADRSLRCGTIGLECLRYGTDCVRELLSGRKYRYEGFLSECSVTDLTASRSSGRFCLTDRV